MHHRLPSTLAATAAVLLALVPAAHAARTAPVTVGGAAGQATFTEQMTPPDQTLINEASTLVRQATPGSTIKVALFSLNDENGFEQALREARAKGVIVRVVFDEDRVVRTAGAAPVGDLDWLVREPGTTSQLELCEPGCISSVSGVGDADGIMHAKFMLLSQIQRPGEPSPRNNVVWVSSANMTEQTGTEPFNNAVTLFDAPGLFTHMSEMWGDMAAHIQTADYFRPENGINTGWGYFHTDALRSGQTVADNEDTFGYASPEAPGQTDLVYGRINDIEGPLDTGGTSCTIRVQQTQILDTRATVVDELVRLKKRGCSVAAVINKKKDSPTGPDSSGEYQGFQIGPNTREKFYCNGIPVHYARVHDKMIISRSKYAGSSVIRPMVLTGSHNLSQDALSTNDEILLRFYDSQSLYDQFLAHFNDAYNINGGTQVVPRNVEGTPRAAVTC